MSSVLFMKLAIKALVREVHATGHVSLEWHVYAGYPKVETTSRALFLSVKKKLIIKSQ